MDYFFTSDLHLGHDNIRKYCNRPFKTLKEMDEAIIKRWNERVKNGDIVFHLGDFCFKSGSGRGEGRPLKADYYINKLNGNIIFVQGNHDNNNSVKTIIQKIVIKYGGHRINMVHNPEHVDSAYDINFVGHVHEKWKFKRIRRGQVFTDAINVGVDMWNFRPVIYREINKAYAKWKRKEKL